MKTYVLAVSLVVALLGDAATGAAVPPATQQVMDTKVSVFDLFLESMEDALDGARLELGGEGMPLLWRIQYDRERDTLIFTFTRTLEGAAESDFLAADRERRKAMMAASLADLLPVLGFVPPEGLDTPAGLLQTAPVRAVTEAQKEAAGRMREELLGRAVAVLVWKVGDRTCVAARAATGPEIDYSEGPFKEPAPSPAAVR